MIKTLTLATACLAASLSTADAGPRHRASVFHTKAHKSLVSSINTKLARWVRRSGKCGGATETLTTYYNSGRRTANGEHFDANGNTAAHRTLPFGTWLTVTNPHNGKSVRVRVNDRGPFTYAKLDLAHGAARVIGMQKSLYLCVI